MKNFYDVPPPGVERICVNGKMISRESLIKWWHAKDEIDQKSFWEDWDELVADEQRIFVRSQFLHGESAMIEPPKPPPRIVDARCSACNWDGRTTTDDMLCPDCKEELFDTTDY